MADINVVWYLIGIGSVALGGTAAMVSPIRKRLDKHEKGKVDVSMCKMLHANLTDDIGEIKADLKTGMEARIKQGESLVRIEALLERKVNGK